MLTLILLISYILTTTTTTTTIVATNAQPPYDDLLINCGSDYRAYSSDSRIWSGDAQSNFTSPNSHSISIESNSSSSVPRVPYTTARIFNDTPFTYTFPLSPGSKFLRLHFYPSNYSAFQIYDSFFNVTAGDYTLLANFSAFSTLKGLKYQTHDYLIKEFVIQVKPNQQLALTFTPSPKSYAFINGIEIVSIPANYYIRGPDYLITYVGHATQFFIQLSTALETLYRFNVGGENISPHYDSGMYRSWFQDDNYVYGNPGYKSHEEIPITYTRTTPNYSAPDIVYTSGRIMQNPFGHSIMWSFPVDSGFHYLLRLYFCEFMVNQVYRVNERVFNIDINNQTADEGFDVIAWSNGNGIPVFIDYVVFMKENGSAKQNLWLAIYPNMGSKPFYASSILNGLEMFKLSGPDHSLVRSNLEPSKVLTTSPKSKNSPMIFVIIGSILGGLTVVSMLGCWILRYRKMVKQDAVWGDKDSIRNKPRLSRSSLPLGLCQRFSLAEIKSATSNFNDNFVIGVGGFGKVYKGYMNNGGAAATTVAIKRLNATSNQGVREFKTEIELLSKLCHVNLVSLIGYCEEKGEMVLVYDYMSNGTLRDHLYNTKNSPLKWKQRLQICIGSARGLQYLHTSAKRKIVHRDVKSTNILLDQKFMAKVSDFGLSKMGPNDISQTHFSTAVKGTFGYLDPEYYRLQQLTEKSDVYSFGVVLFEVLCGRPAIILRLPEEQVNLAEWGRLSYRKGNLDKIIDPQLKGQISSECLIKYGELAYSCVKNRGNDRPSMNDIVQNLEYTLQVQEMVDKMDASDTIVSCYDSINLIEDANTAEDYDSPSFGSIDWVSKSENSSNIDL